MVGGEGGEGVCDRLVLFVGGAEVGAEGQEVLGTRDGAPASRDLLLELDHSDVALGSVVVERHTEVVSEPQDCFAIAVEAHEQVLAGVCLITPRFPVGIVPAGLCLLPSAMICS